jgi:hypothetical protein
MSACGAARADVGHTILSMPFGPKDYRVLVVDLSPHLIVEHTVRIASATAAVASQQEAIQHYGNTNVPLAAIMLALRTALGFSLSCRQC